MVERVVGPARESSPMEQWRTSSAGARNEARRFFKFLVIGAVAFVVDTGSLSALVLLFDANRVVAKGVSFALAVLTSFLGNQAWAYRDSRSKPLARQAMQFCMISVVGLAVNLVVFGFADWACQKIWGSVSSLYVAQAAAVGAAMFWNYAANRFVTYGDVPLGS